MANATSNLRLIHDGEGGRLFHMPVASATHIYKATCQSQDAAGEIVPLTTVGAGHCIGVATHEQDNTGADGAKRVELETDRIFCMPNGAGGAAFLDDSPIGSVVYASDDHTCSLTETDFAMGFFYGLDADGKVRVFVTPLIVPHMAALAAAAL